MTPFAASRMRLGRAVVLLEADDLRVGEVVLEIEDVADVRAAERVDRVVRDESAGDEVVGRLDVDVVDGPVEADGLDPLDDVVAALLGEHRHAGANRRGGHERQRVLRPGDRRPEARRVAPGHRCRPADAIREPDCLVEVLEARLDPPARVARVADREAGALEGGAHVRVAPAQGHAMHRRPPPAVSAQGDREIAPAAFVGGGRVVRKLDVEAGVVDQAQTTAAGVDAGEDAVDQRLIADEAMPVAATNGIVGMPYRTERRCSCAVPPHRCRVRRRPRRRPRAPGRIAAGDR